jgi:hypothetical protein
VLVKRAEPPQNTEIAQRAYLRRLLADGEAERLRTSLRITHGEIAKECLTSHVVVWRWFHGTDPRPPFWQRLLAVLEKLEVLEQLEILERLQGSNR